jgi:hypothetical protein
METLKVETLKCPGSLVSQGHTGAHPRFHKVGLGLQPHELHMPFSLSLFFLGLLSSSLSF